MSQPIRNSTPMGWQDCGSEPTPKLFRNGSSHVYQPLEKGDRTSNTPSYTPGLCSAAKVLSPFSTGGPAIIPHRLGFDPEKLTLHHAGRDSRLTDVQGSVVKEALA